MADESKAPQAPAGETAAQPQPVQIPIDSEHMVSTYANFFRVTGTPEEIVLDFGLNTQQMTAAGTPEAVKLTQRLTMSFYTAKRLLGLLSSIVQQVENSYGALELDPAGFQHTAYFKSITPDP